MTVKILIKRKVSADKAAKLNEFIMQLRQLVVKQPGYVSGESLRNVENPEEYLVISTWNNVDSWKQWLSSKERQEIQAKIDELLGYKTEYEMYEYRP